MSAETKTRWLICSRLIAGETPKEIAESVEDVAYPTILRYKRELEEAQANNTVDEFLNIEEAILNELMETAKKNAPSSIKSQVTEAMSGLITSKTAIEALQLELIVTATAINKQIRAKVLTVEHASELDALTDSLCKIQNSFFNKSLTQVNVQNNYDGNGTNTYSNWLSDTPQETK